MPRQSVDVCNSAWRMAFIQPVTPDDDRCVMLYGNGGEIVGPLTLELAEAWLDQFDNARADATSRQKPDSSPRLPK